MATSSILFNVHCILRTVLYTAHCILCTVYCVVYSNLHCKFCIVYCTLCTVHCESYTVCCAQYNVHCILQTALAERKRIVWRPQPNDVSVYCDLCIVYYSAKGAASRRLRSGRAGRPASQSVCSSKIRPPGGGVSHWARGKSEIMIVGTNPTEQLAATYKHGQNIRDLRPGCTRRRLSTETPPQEHRS